MKFVIKKDVVHVSVCTKAKKGTHYATVPQSVEEMLVHLAREDRSDKNHVAPSSLTACPVCLG